MSLYTSPPGAVYSSEFDPSSRSSSACTTAAPPPAAASHRLLPGRWPLFASSPRRPRRLRRRVPRLTTSSARSARQIRRPERRRRGAGTPTPTPTRPHRSSAGPAPPPPQPRVGVPGPVFLLAVRSPPASCSAGRDVTASSRLHFAKETKEIFVPLANRLGIASWKDQLENLCFKYLNPEEHKELSSKLTESFDEELITSTVDKLDKGLRDAGVSYHNLSGRHKSLYSIHSKMLKKNLTMEEIHDIHGLRLVVEKEEDCYQALTVVHKLWRPVTGRFKDYISRPKLNGYRSLHTVVMSDGIHPFEVQIRTKEMHMQAEYGFAAHWRYKEGTCRHSFVLQMVEWARWVLTWQCEAMSKEQPSSLGTSDTVTPPCPFPLHSEDCPYSYTRQCNHDGPIFVILLEHDKVA
ncbi:hypothetical protein HU200_037661 [Digitaria exilis]|uniref:RelA/SpoT domain-containing protein n=1 Tax=Digitaria exilis TaxID=1010633 RepID=A0A835BE59_9POAL|nr:hypothetical protein HU200_037661 [Digitaria exilis]